MAVFFAWLPEYTTWLILILFAIYDLFAVLCPGGPLIILVKIAQERNEPIPALLFTSSIFRVSNEPSDEEASIVQLENESLMSFDQENAEETRGLGSNGDESNTRDDHQNNGQEEKRSIKLGLGDFVFYSVLIGRAGLYHIVAALTSFVGVVSGLVATMILLSIFRRALPALPISIGLGILFFVFARFLIIPVIFTIGMDAVIL